MRCLKRLKSVRTKKRYRQFGIHWLAPWSFGSPCRPRAPRSTSLAPVSTLRTRHRLSLPQIFPTHPCSQRSHASRVTNTPQQRVSVTSYALPQKSPRAPAAGLLVSHPTAPFYPLLFSPSPQLDCNPTLLIPPHTRSIRPRLNTSTHAPRNSERLPPPPSRTLFTLSQHTTHSDSHAPYSSY